MIRTAVVHLVWSGAAASSLDRFLKSYDQHPAGVDHDLVFILKGFDNDLAGEAQRLALLGDRRYQTIDLRDTQMDLGDYRIAAEKLTHERLCFLNSHAEILADDWLKKLITVLDMAPSAGMVSATGSHEQTSRETPFPNVHLRTNGFLIERRRFLDALAPDLTTKAGCGAFEAGPNSLTQQIIQDGLIPYVVDRQGRAWPPESWAESHTFRMGGQENLLIADNRTRAWKEADIPMRDYLETLAWTDRDPGPNPEKRAKLSYKVKKFLHMIRSNRARF